MTIRLRSRLVTSLVAAGLLAATTLAIACAGAGAEEGAAAAGADPLVVHRGDFTDRQLLTGELRAARAHDFVVPRAPNWRLQIRWLAEDGAEVAAGDPVVEFDSTAFTSNLEQLRLSLAEAVNDIERTRARGEVTEAEKLFVLGERRAAFAKAESRADVPPDLVSPREAQDRRLELERARVAMVKAEQDLAATRAANRSELEMKQIGLGRSRREITTAERALADLTLRAPVAGLFVVEGNRWEGGRKLQEGDNIFVGMTVARMPDLASMEVQAMLSDVDDGRVRPGMEATCRLDVHPEIAYPCRVRAVAPVAREADRTALLRFFEVELALQGADPQRMRPGMSVQAEVTTGEQPSRLLASRRALDLTVEPPRAHLADGSWSEVVLGPCNARHCVVETGLDEGTRLAAAPATLVRMADPALATSGGSSAGGAAR